MPLSNAKLELRSSNANPVAIVQRCRVDALSVDKRAERTVLVLQKPTPTRIADDGMATRNLGIGQ